MCRVENLREMVDLFNAYYNIYFEERLFRSSIFFTVTMVVGVDI